MPRRKEGTPESEVEEAANRMQKYPEHLRSARTSSTWQKFLIDIGVKPEIVKSKSGSDFWDKVRNKVEKKELGITYRQAAEHGAGIETGIFRDAKGRFTKEAEGNIPVVSFRSMETGRFVSRKSLEN